MDGEDEDVITLGEVCPAVKAKLIYTYDFGDDWEHSIEVQKIEPANPVVVGPACISGKLAGPPEECGGVWGYYSLLDALADPKHEGHEWAIDQLGEEWDPEEVDIDQINTSLARWWSQAANQRSSRSKRPKQSQTKRPWKQRKSKSR